MSDSRKGRDPNRRTEVWLRSIPDVEEKGRAALLRLLEALDTSGANPGGKEALGEAEERERLEERGRALAEARKAIDALSIDFALSAYSGPLLLREAAEALDTKYPAISRWRAEVDEWLAYTNPDTDLFNVAEVIPSEAEAAEAEQKKREYVLALLYPEPQDDSRGTLEDSGD